MNDCTKCPPAEDELCDECMKQLIAWEEELFAWAEEQLAEK